MKIITGMHRSGTSLVANMLLVIGQQVDNKETHIGPDRWNKRGYYEAIDFVILNNTILLGENAYSSRPLKTPPDQRNFVLRFLIAISNFLYLFLVFFPDVIDRRANQKQAEITDLGIKNDKKIIKDPRFSLLMKPWLKYANIERVVFCFRNPYEVASSLKSRNKIPPFLGYKLWEFHVEQFLKNSTGVDIVLVKNENFFKQDACVAEIARLYKFLGKRFNEADAKEMSKNIVDSGLKTQKFEGQDTPHNIAKLYALLNELHTSNKIVIRLGEDLQLA